MVRQQLNIYPNKESVLTGHKTRNQILICFLQAQTAIKEKERGRGERGWKEGEKGGQGRERKGGREKGRIEGGVSHRTSTEISSIREQTNCLEEKWV